MNQVKIGEFIAACRKEKKLTQAQLAEKLNITDRAVSKWETGKSMPDSSIMLELCGILGISVNELLSGERVAPEHYEERVDKNLIELKKKEENNVRVRVVISIIFSAALLIGGMVCAICNLAISGKLTWALIPILSILFALIVTFPIIMWGKQGIFGGLLAFSIFVIPYLFVLSRIIQVKTVLSIGGTMALICLVYVWLIYIIFKRLATRMVLATGIVTLIAIPIMLAVNLALALLIGEPIIDMWDVLSMFCLLVIGFALFVYDRARNK